jgi:hypothetical protein
MSCLVQNAQVGRNVYIGANLQMCKDPAQGFCGNACGSQNFAKRRCLKQAFEPKPSPTKIFTDRAAAKGRAWITHHWAAQTYRSRAFA